MHSMPFSLPFTLDFTMLTRFRGRSYLFAFVGLALAPLADMAHYRPPPCGRMRGGKGAAQHQRRPRAVHRKRAQRNIALARDVHWSAFLTRQQRSPQARLQHKSAAQRSITALQKEAPARKATLKAGRKLIVVAGCAWASREERRVSRAALKKPWRQAAMTSRRIILISSHVKKLITKGISV
ncbi:hypothetical protein DPEC_G00094590 [Dallia pectoralis]|uniref:Uncharacterized protein n=1 Tax=Dallia pectoralis TaxID=75939 RepID=A0ACC2H1U2_DALPE|nr:hypothetical protein DPEC_G00094590 [Dallia pectoralis]